MTAIFRNNTDIALVGGIIAILLVLFAPIPNFLLDLLIITNFSFGLMILLMTLYVARPVEFSTFPSLLLVATLFRLALNVAATRLILTQGEAGNVINSIGTFAVQGNFIIGLVVFFILVVVQYVVVTSGAQRVSEVAARFVLDSVPGQQMSIDADLNMGLIDQNEAKARRKNLEREASFYGAMDGASKFVKGDAVAGIIILLINIVAGWIIGVTQLGLDWYEALQRFTLLTIGDGIVTQVPALIISVATGIIVTRSAQDNQLSSEVFRQLASIPKIPIIVMTTLFLLLLLPGMPKWPIFLLMLLFGAIILGGRRSRRAAEAAQSEGEVAAQESGAQGGVEPLIVSLGVELAAAWSGIRPVLMERIAALRNERAEAIGVSLPPVVIREERSLPVSVYELNLFGARVGQGELRADMVLAIRGEGNGTPIDGIETTDPAFGLPALWIAQDASEDARAAGYTLVDPVTVLMTHLTEIARNEAAQFLTRGETVNLLDGVRARQPGLVEELIPNMLSVSDVQRVLQNLIAEEVSIRNMDLIAEALVDVGRQTKDPSELTELVRGRMTHSICHGLRGRREDLSVLTLDPRIEAALDDNLGRTEGGGGMIIEPRVAEQVIRKAIPMVEAMMRDGLAPVVLCGPRVRRHLKTFLRRSLPRLAVIAVTEVPHTITLRSYGVLELE
jgi:flagellar biosynthesis protein FlhA